MADSEISVAQVRQQVLGLERGYTELRGDLHSVEQEMRRGFTAVDQKIAAGFQAVASKLDEKTTPQWQAYGILISVLIALGGALYYPIREQSNKQDAQIERVREQNAKTAQDLAYLQGQLHPIQK
jgi:uncharacterized protein HemX